jgi:hypothetical protein
MMQRGMHHGHGHHPSRSTQWNRTHAFGREINRPARSASNRDTWLEDFDVDLYSPYSK